MISTFFKTLFFKGAELIGPIWKDQKADYSAGKYKIAVFKKEGEKTYKRLEPSSDDFKNSIYRYIC